MPKKNAAAAKALLGTATAAALGFGALARHVAEGATEPHDKKARRKALKRSKRAKKVAKKAGPLGKWYVHVPAALLTAAALGLKKKKGAALTVAGASLGAAALSRTLDRALRHRAPPPGRGEPWEQSFPSGHALEPTAASIAAGYVLVREGVAGAWVAVPLALASLATGLGRLVLDKHWATDSLGGYLAGAALGGACAGAYELTRPGA